MNNNGRFYPGSNIQVPGGCGTGIGAPLVGTFNYIPGCPTGPGATNPNVPSQTTLLSSGSSRTIRYTIVNTTLDSIYFRIGELDDTCLELVEDEADILPETSIVGVGDPEVSSNKLGRIAHCVTESGTTIGFGLFVKPNSEDLTTVRVIQAVFNIFDQCPINDVELRCADGCGSMSQFYGDGFYAGGNAAVLVEIPAETTTVVDLCGCIQETTGLVGAPDLRLAASPVPLVEVCPPVNGISTNGGGYVNRGF